MQRIVDAWTRWCLVLAFDLWHYPVAARHDKSKGIPGSWGEQGPPTDVLQRSESAR